MNSTENKLDENLKFVAKHYKQGIFDPDKKWHKITGKKSYSLINPAVLMRVASVAIILVIIGFIFRGINKENIITAQNIETMAVLPDKSEITLQPHATLSYDRAFNKKMRAVRMNGSISFKVVRDTQKPFLVHTQNTEIKVLGTVFNVNSNNETTDLKVISGKVRFSPDSIPVSFICTKNMYAKYNSKAKIVALNSPDWSCSIAKNTNSIQFKNAPLAEVCHILNQYYNVSIALPTKDAALKLTTTLADKNINEIISIINLTLDTHLTY